MRDEKTDIGVENVALLFLLLRVLLLFVKIVLLLSSCCIPRCSPIVSVPVPVVVIPLYRCVDRYRVGCG